MVERADVLASKAARCRSLQVAPSRRFDWIMIGFGGWLMAGMSLDGWAHKHLGKELDTFFTPWHGVLYSGLLAVSAYLTTELLRHHRAGAPWRQALPPGYAGAILGVMIFWLGGAADLLWHTLLGIEVGVEALVSPSHLVLAVGATLIVTGPLRAAWCHRQTEPPRLALQLPMLLSVTFMLTMFNFFTQYAHPLVMIWLTKDVSKLLVDAELYLMRADGTEQMRLTNNPGFEDVYPAWSPDGRRIAFASSREKVRGLQADRDPMDIYIMDVDGGHRTRLTNAGQTNLQPSWSPDGQRLYFASEREGNLDIYVMNADGRDLRRLTTSDGDDGLPAASPDGRKLAFTSKRDGNTEIYLMNADGTDPVNLTRRGAHDWGPAWSPDGRKIAFTSDRDGNSEIYVMDADGAHPARLTHEERDDSLPLWSPDGRRIVFASNRGGPLEIYIMAADGSDVRNLTNTPNLRSGEGRFSWAPSGQALVFSAKGNFPASPSLRQALGTTGVFFQAALLMGVVLIVMQRWTLPFGSLTVIFTLNAALLSVLGDEYKLMVVALAAGLTADTLLLQLTPSAARPWALRLFAFLVPLTFYGMYFVVLGAATDLGWSFPLCAGATVIAGIIGWLLSYVQVPPFTAPGGNPR